MTESNRRDFLRGFGLRAVRETRDAVEVGTPGLIPRGDIGALRSVITAEEVATGVAATGWSPPAPAKRSDAVPAARCMKHEELADLLLAEGLAHRTDPILVLTLRSVRMTRLVGESTTAAAWLDLHAATGLLDAQADSVLLAQVSLSSEMLAGTAVHGEGWLAVSVAGDGAASAVRLEAPVSPTATAVPMMLSAHLALPRVWSGPVEALGLSTDERDRYIRVRDALARAQGIEVDQSGGAALAHHRLFGYPDETTGLMPAECCEALGDADWQLLIQVSTGAHRRVYVWIADRDLNRTVAFIR